MENITEIEIKPIKRKTTNAERIKKWKSLHRQLEDNTKYNLWRKYKKIYLNILLDLKKV